MIRVIYVESSTDVAYGLVSGIFKMVQASWSTADDTTRATAFAQLDEGCADIDSIAVLGEFKAYTYMTGENVIGISRPVNNGTDAWTQTQSDGNGIYFPRCFVRAVPKAQVLLPKSLMPLYGVNAIKQVAIHGIVSDNSKICAAITTDLNMYKVYDFSAQTWQDIDITNKVTFLESGIDIKHMADIPQSAWAEIGTDKLAFAYIIQQYNRLATAEVDRTTLTLSLIGRWDKAINGTDYRYGYITRNGIDINVTFLKNGSYKVNYTDADTSREVESGQEAFGIGCIEGTIDDFIMVDAKGDNLL